VGGGALNLETFDKIFNVMLRQHFKGEGRSACYALGFSGEAIMRCFWWTTVASQQLYSRQCMDAETMRVGQMLEFAPGSRLARGGAGDTAGRRGAVCGGGSGDARAGGRRAP
jgi:hypothetical protein